MSATVTQWFNESPVNEGCYESFPICLSSNDAHKDCDWRRGKWWFGNLTASNQKRIWRGLASQPDTEKK